LDTPPSTPPPTTTSPRPLWLTLFIVITLLSAISDLWTAFRLAEGAPLNILLSAIQTALLLTSAVGLWRMRRWGVSAFAAGVAVWLLIRLPLQLAAAPVYFKSSALWCMVTFALALYAAVFVGLVRLWRQHRLR
jgi:hypothetical protein